MWCGFWRVSCRDVGAVWREGASGRFGTWKSETPLVPNRPVSTNTQSCACITRQGHETKNTCLCQPLFQVLLRLPMSCFCYTLTQLHIYACLFEITTITLSRAQQVHGGMPYAHCCLNRLFACRFQRLLAVHSFVE